jgi:hypothetical protein
MNLNEQATQPTEPSYRLIQLSQGLFAKVDAADFDWLMQWKWHARFNKNTNSFYAVRVVTLTPGRKGKKKSTWMHREIVGNPLGFEVDHKDLDTLNNVRLNLRPATRSQNCMNRSMRSDNRSGFKGVRRAGRRWIGQITVDRKSKYLGTFDTAELAYAAYIESAKVEYGEFFRP